MAQTKAILSDWGNIPSLRDLLMIIEIGTENHDLTKRRLSLLNEARDAMRDGWFAYADVNSNLKLRKGERFLKFNTREELAAHVESLFPHAPPQAAGEGVADISDISDLVVEAES
jgi:hypothetical protein